MTDIVRCKKDDARRNQEPVMIEEFESERDLYSDGRRKQKHSSNFARLWI